MCNRFMAAVVILAYLACVQAQTCTPIQWCNTYNAAGTKCTACASGYILAAAAPASNTFAANSDGSVCVAVGASATATVPIKVANCLTYTPAVATQDTAKTQCSACETGYTLGVVAVGTGPSTCTAAIANCATYTSATVCATCSSGYVLAAGAAVSNAFAAASNGAACVAVVATATAAAPVSVSNCKTYTPVVATQSTANTQCSACDTGYFLTAVAVATGPSTCTQITNCAVHTSATVCATCAPGYILAKANPAGNKFVDASDGTICSTPGTAGATTAATVANCYMYTPAVANQAVANTQCSMCSSGYYLTAVAVGTGPSVCTAGSLTGCQYYSSASACATCLPGTTKIPVPAASPASASQVQSVLVAALLALLALMQ